MFTVPSTHARIGGEQLARKGVVLEMKPPRPLMFEDLEIQLPEIPVVEMCLSQSVSIAAIPRVGRTALHGLLVTHHLRRRRRGWWGPVGTRFHAQRACRQGAANKDQHRTCFIVGSYIVSEEQLFSAIAVPRQSRWTWEIYLTQCDQSSTGVGLSGRWESHHPLPRTLFYGA